MIPADQSLHVVEDFAFDLSADSFEPLRRGSDLSLSLEKGEQRSGLLESRREGLVGLTLFPFGDRRHVDRAKDGGILDDESRQVVALQSESLGVGAAAPTRQSDVERCEVEGPEVPDRRDVMHRCDRLDAIEVREERVRGRTIPGMNFLADHSASGGTSEPIGVRDDGATRASAGSCRRAEISRS